MTLLAGGLPLAAQEPGKTTVDAKTKTKSTKRAYDPARRVPNFFGQLGLSDAQKESIYKIQGKHMPQIDALEKQLEDLRVQMLAECESVLTGPQKQMLADRRNSAAEARTKRAGSAPSKPQG
jgi:Spy/CpxP family protein refolding chaperone